MIEITINGESHQFEKLSSISDILNNLSVNVRSSAVAVNDRVVPRSEHETYKVDDGDRVEIIRAVGGG